ncbi:MAG: glycosyltransferase family 2 protein [Muribaculaceae bacterium]|nr:glycosyltransferase family 2 protein [Muribaculaceae bacterium]
MISNPLSIVIPVRNREKLILRALDSVYNQTYRPIRLIVVDNDSTDATVPAVEKWKSAHESEDFSVKIVSETSPGAAAARNRGLLEVDTDYMLFFDSDDVMLPELAITVMEAFEKNKKLDLVYWRTAYINAKEEVIPKRFAKLDLIRRHIYNGVLCTISYAIRTSFIKRIGGWDSSLKAWDDWELGLRILLNEPYMKGIFRVLVHIYPQTDSITGTDFHSKAGEWEKAIAAMEKDARELTSGSLQRRILSMLLYRKINLAALYSQENFSTLGRDLLETSLKSSGLSKWKKRLLRLIYTYTKNGGRGGYLLWD